ncbi:uncharacterized protein [Amphiura filiformis]|uniref:uncharacterized protein n=1 Tax=Amphiura filiformis TaxID=82378 RepID=UPI003B2269A1
MGSPHHGGGGGGAAHAADKAQRRATSSGVPSRSRGKAHRNANSTVNPATSHAAAQVQPTSTSPKKLYQDKSDRHTPDVRNDDNNKAGEQARAHTHGHAQRKQKHAAQKANHKSQLVTDYMDAGSGLTSALTVPNLAMGNDSDHHSDDSLSQKVAELKNAGRERARAHSHGHRKHKAGESKQKQNKINDANSKYGVGSTTAQSVPEIAAAIAAENGHGIYTPPHREEEEESHYDTPKRQHQPPDVPDMPYEAVHVQEINEPIPDNMPELIAEVKKLRNSNAKLRRELIDAKKAVEKDARKIDGMEAELRRLRHREAEDAKTLETMVQHVEANLKRTTERAVTAENTITKLKAEIKSLKSELNTTQGHKKKPEDKKEYKEMKEKAHATSLKLATAAKEAETNIKQLMQGVDVLKLMAETLACIDRVTEEKGSTEKGYGTSL